MGTLSYESFGRTNQKRRTRLALKEAAATLVRAGVTPTIAEVADSALVARSTAYRYFPSRDALIAEVLVDITTAEDRQRVYEAAAAPGTAEERLAAVIAADHAMVAHQNAAYRKMLRAMLDVEAGPSNVPRRGGHRLNYLGTAVDAVTAGLDTEQRERLIAALSMCTGIEAAIVTNDICGLDPSRALEVKKWAALALLREAVRDTEDHPVP